MADEDVDLKSFYAELQMQLKMLGKMLFTFGLINNSNSQNKGK